ncbi:hypothetical protein [Actinocrispum wychmicini]|uniref:Uncharacterized protein n=1 Tax=Actinocrispum wychmicini TaxID=1213861 RepID=A0A4R2JI17_9PSEU|nr:hypothetical protein [Actinocrispum wychmicini]TCO53765.1 hypothetical protein EV192_110357 [Actinocrispum wychmicini]
MGRIDHQSDQESVASSAPVLRPAEPGFLAAGNQAIGRLLGMAGEVGQGLLGQELRGSVGAGGVNLPGDVLVVSRLLGMPADLNAAIVRFQQEELGWPQPDGRVDPGGKTFHALQHHQAPAPVPAAPTAPAAPVAPGSIEAELAALEALQQKALKAGQQFEEGGPARGELVARIGQVRVAVEAVPEAARKAEYFHRLNAIAPFYTQAANQNIIGRAVATTCNLTTVAMGLEMLGKSAADYQGNWETMHAVETWANKDLKNAGIDFEHSRLADFMELVAVIECLGNVPNPTDEAINAARMKALGTGGATGWVASGTEPLKALYARFGVKTQVVTSPNSDALRALGKEKFAGVWGTIDARQKAERKGKSTDEDVVAAGHTMAGADADEAKIHMEGYKHWAMTTFGPFLDAGRPVSVGQYNHWMRLQAITDDFVIVDDPGGGSRVNRRTAWEEARAEGLFWQSVVATG